MTPGWDTGAGGINIFVCKWLTHEIPTMNRQQHPVSTVEDLFMQQSNVIRRKNAHLRWDSNPP